MAQVDLVNYFSIIIWFNLLFFFFYLINYTYIIPIIYNNLYIRSKILQSFINKNKLKYSKIFLLTSKNLDKFFNSYDFHKINLNIYNIYSNFVIHKIVLC
jgi:hypothetical protein